MYLEARREKQSSDKAESKPGEETGAVSKCLLAMPAKEGRGNLARGDQLDRIHAPAHGNGSEGVVGKTRTRFL